MSSTLAWPSLDELGERLPAGGVHVHVVSVVDELVVDDGGGYEGAAVGAAEQGEELVGEAPSTTRSGAWPKMAICRWCDSDMPWHLKPFSSRHCFRHIWQYHRSFCSPLALIRFAIAFGVWKSPFPMTPTTMEGFRMG